MSSKGLSHEEAIVQFCGVTGANEDRAKGLLEACDWNLELAINMHVDTDDGRGNNKPSTSSTNNRSGGPSTSTSNQPEIVDISDSIIKEEEDEDDQSSSNERSSSNRYDRYRPIQTARRGGAFSARTTSCSTFDNDVDEVRPPIPPVRQVLVRNSDGYSQDLPQRRYNTRTGAMSDVYDAFRDFQAEAHWQEMAQDGESSAADSQTASNVNKRTLQELFRPPLEVMFRGSLSSAREAGTQQNKWLLVNIQNGREFACQILNRDVWSNQTVKDILKEHFLFWQVYHDSYEGSRYTQFYKVESFPHVSIIDPRTGEQMKSWPKTIDHNSFCDSVIEFLTEHSSPDGSSDVNTMKKLRVKEEDLTPTLYDQSEEAQLEAAIKASLQETTENSNSSKAYADEDSYTDAIESDTDQTRTSDYGHMNIPNNNDNNRSNSNSNSDFCGKIGKKLATSNNNNSTKFEEISDNNKMVIENNSSSSQSSSASSSSNVNNINTNDKTVKVEKEIVLDDYKKYLGVDKEKFSDLNVRFPDGTRDQFKFPSDSLMKALFLLLTSKGYGMDQYNYVTNFPRRLLHELPSTDTFQDAKLFRETIFVERRFVD